MPEIESPRSAARTAWRVLFRLVPLAAALIVAAPSTLASAAPSPSASPSGSGSASKPDPNAATFGIGPATATKLDRRSSLSYFAGPGARTTDHVGIVNLGRQPLTLSLYTVDAVNAANGAVAYRSRTSPGTDARTWITVDLPHGATSLRVPAHHTVIVPLSIHVPRNATPGDHLAGVVVSLLASAANSQGAQVGFEQRVALRATFVVNGKVRPQLVVRNLSAHYDGTADPIGSGTVTVTYTVRNTGNIALGAAQQVDVSGLFGTDKPAKAVAALPTLLPGNSATQTVRISGVYPAVHLSAHVTLKPTATAIPGAVVPTLTPVSAGTGLWAIPWALIVTLLVLVALVVGALFWRRSRGRAGADARHRPQPQPHRPQPRTKPQEA